MNHKGYIGTMFNDLFNYNDKTRINILNVKQKHQVMIATSG